MTLDLALVQTSMLSLMLFFISYNSMTCCTHAIQNSIYVLNIAPISSSAQASLMEVVWPLQISLVLSARLVA